MAGIKNSARAQPGNVAPIVTGLLLKTTGHFEEALVVGGAMFVLASLAMGLVVGKVETITVAANSPRAPGVAS